MKKKYEFNNVNSLDTFNDINGEISVKYPEVKFNVNYEKFYFLIESDNDDFDFNNILDIVKYYLPEIDLVLKEAEEIYRKILYLENLDCANCAAKVERLAKRTFNHERIIVDFATTKFIIETTDKQLIDNIETELKKITSQVDKNINPKLKKSEEIEINKKTRKVNKVLFFVALGIFTIALLLQYVVFYHICPEEGFNPNNLTNTEVFEHIVLIILYGMSYLLFGWDVLLGAFRNIKSGRVFDEKFLMSIATILAYAIGSFIEAVAVMVFYKFGEMLQDIAVNRSRKSINSLMEIKSEVATVIVNDKEIVVDPEEIVIDDIIIVKPGERIPLDGVILEGEASLDTSSLTGESKYTEVAKNDNVISGSINVNGYLKIKVTKLYNESMVSKIVDMVSNASLKKANTENIVTRIAKYYTPIVCGFALLVIIFNLFFKVDLISSQNIQYYIHEAVYPAMIFLVVSCPCALIISVPLGFFGGIGAASKKGILIKGSNYLENLSKVGLVVFDKTGTLTKGQFKVSEIVSEQYSKEQLLEYAAYCEVGSIHPIAKSIIDEYGRDKIDFSKIIYLHSPSKKGNIIKLDEIEICVGNKSYMKEMKIKVPKLEINGLIVYVAVNGKYEGYISLVDEIREEAYETIRVLKEMKIDVAMVTGDTEEIANEVARKLKIEKIYANMSPIDKVRRVRKLKKNYGNKKVIFVGDGMNDAPVLSSADVGVAMGGLGSDAAIDVADIVLLKDDLYRLITAIKTSTKTMRIVKQNIIFSLVIKIAVLILVIIDNFIKADLAKMWEGVFADVGVSMIAIINSLRATEIKFRDLIPNFIKIKK